MIEKAKLEFTKWQKSGDGEKRKKEINKEKRVVKKLMRSLHDMEGSPGFTDKVLSQLLPHKRGGETRTSIWGGIQNIKKRIEGKTKYSDEEWNYVAELIFSLVDQCQKKPQELKESVEKFTSDQFSNHFQCGSITPVLFCINGSFPIITTRVVNVYQIFSENQGWGDEITMQLKDYPENIRRCGRLMKLLGLSVTDFDMFCAHYNTKETPPPPKLEGMMQYSIKDIIKDGCFVEESKLKSIMDVLKSKKNLILQGPPGTGKTYLAKRLAFALIGYKEKSRVNVVQFHPNISYEDFVRGWRPNRNDNGTSGLDLVDGLFLEMIKKAIDKPEDKFVMVIEEINRGNPANIFGEMLTLLEADKRKSEYALTLSYMKKGEDPVYVPENMYVIGTMNVADRSIALVDLALRRRFGFYYLEPVFGKTWKDWVHKQYAIDTKFLDVIGKRLESLNKTIENNEYLGSHFKVGHSYVTPNGNIPNSEEWFNRIVKTEIVPLLNEYWIENPDTVEKEKKKLLQEFDS